MAKDGGKKVQAIADKPKVETETRIVRFDVDLDTHRQLRMIVASLDTSITDYMKQLLLEDIRRRKLG